MSYKTTNDLMQHLRDNGIAISGETQKQQLVTTGYYHGYKGYRFFKSAGARLPFSSYQELYATIQAVASIVIHPDLTKRMEILKNYI